MKWCNICSKGYRDNFYFCTNCGSELTNIQEKNSHRRINIIILSLFVLVITATIVGTLYEHIKYKEQQEGIAESQYQKVLEEYKNTPTISDLAINSDWTHYIKGNYIYIEGSVTNKSTKNIRYYEVGIKFLDS